MIKDICEKYLGKEEAEEFALWAFGENYKKVSFNQFPELWNNLHSDFIVLEKSGKFRDDIPRMIFLWMLEKE